MTPQARDRWMQVFLAQARGARRNAELLCQSVDLMLAMQARRTSKSGVTPMEQALIQTLIEADRALDDVGIAYAVTGSIASGLYGEPVMSLDVDLVVRASVDEAVQLAKRLQPRFYAPEDMLAEAARQNSFANVVDNATGLKVDLSFVPATGFLAEVIGRRVKESLAQGAPEFWFVMPEDVILMKLLWRRETQSAKQWENALNVARVRGARMDWKYLFERSRALGIEEDLERLRDEAGI